MTRTQAPKRAKRNVLKSPLLPAIFAPLGAERSRRQRDGVEILFRSVRIRVEWRDVPSKLDGYSSNWYSHNRQWVPVDALIEGQNEMDQRV